MLCLCFSSVDLTWMRRNRSPLFANRSKGAVSPQGCATLQPLPIQSPRYQQFTPLPRGAHTELAALCCVFGLLDSVAKKDAQRRVYHRLIVAT